MGSALPQLCLDPFDVGHISKYAEDGEVTFKFDHRSVALKKQDRTIAAPMLGLKILVSAGP